ncbi:hypothetical protein BC939DRAFT_457406 [Gamsiella multidivaricata]|uniref:uncharacterized protein n=1 Tax=Gamsiella multidivaricata TaxID=101098 RepID=UPI00221E873F|nr:uncharacterized protein BC939DRAFT_457406 [Gamsiella multidivaricata]KAI7820699.1 hypothetical protein BC939DRAFT_457406 [Gamsiella multidivaricata]
MIEIHQPEGRCVAKYVPVFSKIRSAAVIFTISMPFIFHHALHLRAQKTTTSLPGKNDIFRLTIKTTMRKQKN